MIHHIDVSLALRRSVRDVYTDLVTRPTGAAVRAEIEQQLAHAGDAVVTVIDFTHVGLLDFSCADEIVAKLLLRYREAGPGPRYFVFRGMSESHLDAIEAVLERHGLALVLELDDGAAHLVGALGDGEREAWQAMRRLGRADAAALAATLGAAVEEAARWLDALDRHRLVIRREDGYIPVPLAS